MSEIASRLFDDLLSWGFTPTAAKAHIGNLAHESGDFKTLQEINPLIPGSKGGYGYASWTGPRRRDYMAYCTENRLAPDSYAANVGYMQKEIREGKHVPKDYIKQLNSIPDLAEATRFATDSYFRPGVKAYGSRLKYAQNVGKTVASDLQTGNIPEPPPLLARNTPAAPSAGWTVPGMASPYPATPERQMPDADPTFLDPGVKNGMPVQSHLGKTVNTVNALRSLGTGGKYAYNDGRGAAMGLLAAQNNGYNDVSGDAAKNLQGLMSMILAMSRG
jgi:Phage tail lysozyme